MKKPIELSKCKLRSIVQPAIRESRFASSLLRVDHFEDDQIVLTCIYGEEKGFRFTLDPSTPVRVIAME